MLCWKFRGTEVPVGTVTGPRANAGSGGLEVCPWFAGELVTAGEGARVVPTAKNTSSWHGLQLCKLVYQPVLLHRLIRNNIRMRFIIIVIYLTPFFI